MNRRQFMAGIAATAISSSILPSEDRGRIGVVDRVEGETAVVVLDDGGEISTPHREVEAERVEGAVVEVRGGGAGVEYLPGETSARRDRAQRRFDELSERP